MMRYRERSRVVIERIVRVQKQTTGRDVEIVLDRNHYRAAVVPVMVELVDRLKGPRRALMINALARATEN